MPERLRWLLTVQAPPQTSLPTPGTPVSVELVISSLRTGAAGDEEPPNPNCLGPSHCWPPTVERRRPDGVSRIVELRSMSAHLSYTFAFRSQRDAQGRIPNPWVGYAVLVGVAVADIPLGSELWGVLSAPMDGGSSV